MQMGEMIDIDLADFGAEETARKLATVAMSTYQTNGERAALRCAMGDAASLLDRLANNLGNAARKRNRIPKRAMERAALLTQAANAIWAMRELVSVPPAEGR